MEELTSFDPEEVPEMGEAYRVWHKRCRTCVDNLSLGAMILVILAAVVWAEIWFWTELSMSPGGALLFFGGEPGLWPLLVIGAAVIATFITVNVSCAMTIYLAILIGGLLKLRRNPVALPTGYSDEMAIKAAVLKTDIAIYNARVENLKDLSDEKARIEADLIALRAYQEAQASADIDELTLRD